MEDDLLEGMLLKTKQTNQEITPVFLPQTNHVMCTLLEHLHVMWLNLHEVLSAIKA